MNVLITAGGTAEPVDDVRVVSNFSTGRFPVALAIALSSENDSVRMLGSREACYHAATAAIPAERFGSSASLDALLSDAASADPKVDVVIHLAAVSDYVTDPAAGKLSSDEDELVIRMRRNHKLIDTFRDRFAPHTFIVAGKLTSKATPAETIAAGRKLLKRTRASLVIANELSELHDGQHPCWLLTQEGGEIRVEGNRMEVAAAVADFIRRRSAVSWSATRYVADGDTAPPTPEVRLEDGQTLAAVLQFAAEASLLPGLDGNAVVRLESPQLGRPALLVTPRQVPKSELTALDALVVAADLEEREVWAWPSLAGDVAKPSIDTSVQARILAHYDNIELMLHSHECFGRPQATTTFPYPCGAAEEATAVVDAATAAGVDPATRELFVELIHHGFLLGMSADRLAELRAAFATQLAEFEDHLVDVGQTDRAIERVVPVFSGLDIVGVVAHVDGGVSVHLGAASRGLGLGSVIAAQLTQRRLAIVTVDECDVIRYWESKGFTTSRRDDGTAVLTPPATGDTYPR